MKQIRVRDLLKVSKSILCAHCSNTSRMESVGYISPTIEEDLPSVGNDVQYTYYSIYICGGCLKEVVIKYILREKLSLSSKIDEDIIQSEILYPKSKNLPLGLPEHIKHVYEAAEKIKDNPNPYAMMLRRMLEMVCIDKGAKGNTLARQLDDLGSRYELPNKLIQVASSLRNFGNIGAHAGLGEVSIQEIPLLTSLVDAILQYIYSAPYLAAIAEKKLEEIKKGTTTLLKASNIVQ